MGRALGTGFRSARPRARHAWRDAQPHNSDKKMETTNDTMKLKFDGWYRLWDDRIDGDAAEKNLDV